MSASKTKLLYIFSKPRDFEHLAKYSSVIFYGYNKFRKNPDFKVSVLKSGKKNLFWLFWRPFELYFYSKTGAGFRLNQILTNLKLINSQDIVLAVNDSAGIPLALLKKLKLIKPKIAFISAGLINNLENHQRGLVFKFYRWLLQGADVIFCWSPLEKNLYKALTKTRAEFILLEPDLDFYQPEETTVSENFVFAIGRDVGRDFQTLFRVLGDLRIPAKIIAHSYQVRNLKTTPNIEIHTERVNLPVLMDWYNKARIVIVNLKEIHRFTGQRVLLGALAMGKAIIAAETKSLKSTYNLKHNQEIIFYEPGNANDLKSKIKLLYNDPDKIRQLGEKARRFAENLPKNAFYKTLEKVLLELTT